MCPCTCSIRYISLRPAVKHALHDLAIFSESVGISGYQTSLLQRGREVGGSSQYSHPALVPGRRAGMLTRLCISQTSESSK